MKWSVPIIVVALAACILAGSVGFQDTIRETTEYESVLSDLSPIAEAGPVTDVVNYNPLTNVTGWTSNVFYETQTSASLYKYETELQWTSGTSAVMSSAGVWVLEPGPLEDTPLKEWDWSDGVVDDGGSSIRNTPSGDVIGGWSGYIVSTWSPITQIISSSVHATLEGVQYSYARTLKSFNIPNNSVIEPTDVDGGVLGVMTASPGSWFFNDDVSGETIRWTATMDLGAYDALDFDVYYRDGLFYRIVAYDDSGRPQLDESQTYVISLVSNSLSSYFTYDALTGSNTYYIKPYTFAKLIGVGTAIWSNGYGNTSVQILADADNIMFSVNDEPLPEVGFIDLQDPAYDTWANGYTGLVLFTLNVNGDSYWQGVTSYSNTKDFTVAEYRYPLYDVDIDGPITQINFMFVGGDGYRAAIVDTWIPQDSNGLLWDDATFRISSLFPQLWTDDNLRVKFNSFVATGDGITINGVTYPVADGNVTIDGDTFKVAGSALEWTADGETSLVAPNGDRYDLGARSGTIILNGVWYGILSLDTFETTAAPAKDAVFGEIPALAWVAWVFVGVLVVGTVGVLATGRQLDITDMLVLALLGFSGLTVAVMI